MNQNLYYVFAHEPLFPFTPETATPYQNPIAENFVSKFKDNLLTAIESKYGFTHPEFTLIDKLWLLNQIKLLGPFKVHRIAIYLAQVPANSYSGDFAYLNNKANHLILLYSLLDVDGNKINKEYYDFQFISGEKTIPVTFSEAFAQTFFDHYDSSGNISYILEQRKNYNTKIIHFEKCGLIDLCFEANQAADNFQYIKLVYAEINAYFPLVTASGYLTKRLTPVHKQFCLISYSVDNQFNVIQKMPPYDINSLCPPECNLS